MSTVGECLSELGVKPAELSACDGLDEEFVKVKRAYFKRALRTHPDKGGDPAAFRKVQSAFEVLRDLYDTSSIGSFASAGHMSTDDSYGDAWTTAEGMPTPSYEYYYAAAEEPVPLYKVEPAKSGRSKCKQTGSARRCPVDSCIAKGELRVGSLESKSGSYGRWHRLGCWRLPSKIWLGLPDPDVNGDAEQFETALLSMNEVLLCGFSELDAELRRAVCDYVMDKGNWARLTKRSSQKAESAAAAASAASSSSAGAASSSSAGAGASAGASASSLASVDGASDVVPQGYHAPRERFVAPVPGRDGARPHALAGQTVVLTGLFPEVGGGTGLSLGKDRVKAIVASFGGRVTGSISGKTDILIVGKSPGFSKVSKARANPRIRLMSLRDLKIGIEGRSLDDAPSASKPLVIQNFSAGYTYRSGISNGLAARADSASLAIAAGRAAPTKQLGATAKKRGRGKAAAAAASKRPSSSAAAGGGDKKRKKKAAAKKRKPLPGC